MNELLMKGVSWLKEIRKGESMMKIQYYVVDAFTNKLFQGNPAGVCLLEKPLDAETMQKIAHENNLSETAFVLKNENGYFLRWFTPKFEIDLCGHATLASAFVVSNFIDGADTEEMRFSTVSGELKVKQNANFYEMIFPSRIAEKISLSKEQQKIVNCSPTEVYAARDLLLVLDNEEDVRNYVPDYSALRTLTQWLGLIITAKGKDADFISRYFCPELNLEDPVTGSSHCNLIPYWSEKLGKKKMIAKQLSDRGGVLYCELLEDRVKIAGEAVLYLKGDLQIE